MEERIKKLIEYYGLNTRQFEQKISASNGQIYTLLSRGGNLNMATLVKILENCNEISPDWLLLGKGKMLREEVKKSEPNSEMNINFYKKIISDLQELIDHQREELLKLQAELTQEREKSVSSSAKIETASI